MGNKVPSFFRAFFEFFANVANGIGSTLHGLIDRVKQVVRYIFGNNKSEGSDDSGAISFHKKQSNSESDRLSQSTKTGPSSLRERAGSSSNLPNQRTFLKSDELFRKKIDLQSSPGNASSSGGIPTQPSHSTTPILWEDRSVQENQVCLKLAQNFLQSRDELFENSEILTDQNIEEIALKIRDLLLLKIKTAVEINSKIKAEGSRNLLMKGRELHDALEQLGVRFKTVEEEEVLNGQTVKQSFEVFKKRILQLQNHQELNEIINHQQGSIVREYAFGANPSLLSSKEVESAFSGLVKKLKCVDEVNKKLSGLIDLAQLNEGIRNQYDIQVIYQKGAKDRPYKIQGVNPQNVSIGYSLFCLLQDAAVIPSTKLWNGEQSFDLNESELDKITDTVERFVRWYGEFGRTITPLLGKNVEYSDYLQLGQKSAKETKNSFNQKVSLQGRRCFEGLDGEHTCLLLSQLSLRLGSDPSETQNGDELVDHPEKDFLRDQFNRIYRLEKMSSWDGKQKQFVLGTYRSNLSVSDVKKICNRLNQLLAFQQFMMKTTSQPSLKKALDVFNKNHSRAIAEAAEQQAWIRYYADKLFKTFGKIIDGKELGAHIQSLETACKKTLSLGGDMWVDRCAEIFQKHYDKILSDITVPYFKDHSTDHLPSNTDILNLYGGVDRKRSYGPTVGVFRDVRVLFEKLKQAPVVSDLLESAPEIALKLDGLREAVEERLTRKYHTLPEEGWPSSKRLIRGALQDFEFYVAMVVGRKATDLSIRSSISQMIGLDIEELKAGCDEGLQGRLIAPLIALETNSAKSFDSQMIQFQKTTLDRAANQQLTDLMQQDPWEYRYENGNTADRNKSLGDVLRSLGIVPEGGPKKQLAQLDKKGQAFLKYFLKEYTSVVVSNEAKAIFEHALWALTLERKEEEEDNRVYEILRDLGFEGTDEDLDATYRIGGEKENAWQYGLIQIKIQEHLPAYLLSNRWLTSALNSRGERLLFQRKGQENYTVRKGQENYTVQQEQVRPLPRFGDPIARQQPPINVQPQPEEAPVYVAPR